MGAQALVQELEKLLTIALQTVGNHWPGVPILNPTISRGDGFALGTLAFAAALLVLYVTVHSPVHVQLFTATAGALLGILAVRNSTSPAFKVYVKPFRNDTSRLALVGDAMLQKARTKNQPLSIIVFDFSDLPELQIVYQGQVPRDLGPTIEKRLGSVAPAKGAVVRTGPSTFTVLLPNFDTSKTLRAVHGAFGKACCFEFAEGGSEVLLLPDFAVKTVGGGTESVEDVYQVLCGDLRKARRHIERRQLYLRRERESHTRPMTLSSTGDALIRRARLPDAASMASTMPG